MVAACNESVAKGAGVGRVVQSRPPTNVGWPKLASPRRRPTVFDIEVRIRRRVRWRSRLLNAVRCSDSVPGSSGPADAPVDFGHEAPAVRTMAVTTETTHHREPSAQGIPAGEREENEIVSLLEDPGQRQFSGRGLVVGHVQSGKTANMTAVAAKALDAGYDTVIVLAGLTNKLRYQTQLRLFHDLVSRNLLNWQVLTPNELDRDFRSPPQGGFLSHLDKAQLAVVKKNVSPLRELKAAVKRTLPAVRSKLRVLLVDDECDQASINSARSELDMTAINGRIRELLSLLPAVTYVGYTATPFANVLINPYRADGQELDDFYPRDFITALPRPDGYFGTERLFGLDTGGRRRSSAGRGGSGHDPRRANGRRGRASATESQRAAFLSARNDRQP